MGKQNFLKVVLNKYSPIFIFLIVTQLTTFLLISCEDEVIQPPPKPSGYQEDIPWPSLANSPWPTNHADMQRTGRSKYVGPQQGIVFKKVPALEMGAGVVFGNDSVFYFGANSNIGNATLVAAKIDGTILWTENLVGNETTTTPLIDNNGSIYIANYRKIFAFNADGTTKWIYETQQEVWNRGLGIGKDGTIYAIDNGSTLYAIKQDGILLWQSQDSKFGAGSRVNLTFSPDGNTMYIHGNRLGNENLSLIAFDLVIKSIKWTFGTASMENGPMVDSEGNIYLLIADGIPNQNIANFYCLDPNGNVKWKFPNIRIPLYYDIDPTIDKDGNIYFATDTLFALEYSGKLRWKLGLENQYNNGAVICDNIGTIYIATSANYFDGKIIAVSKEGIIKWVIQITDEFSVGLSPALTKNGTLVYSTWHSQNLLIIK